MKRFHITYSKDHVMMGTDTSTLDRGFGQEAGPPSSIVTVRPWRKIK